jgi:sulfatase modifying factor 1
MKGLLLLLAALALAPAASALDGMRLIPNGRFEMGSHSREAWPEEGPPHQVVLSRAYWMDETEVSNREFARFVAATGYRTIAERPVKLRDIMAQLPKGAAGPPAHLLQPGSLVFVLPSGPVDPRDTSPWWRWTPGANWRAPEGPGSTIARRADHPVVHLAWEDAQQYCKWAGKRLPTEAEWERAARGGVDGLPYVWGSEQPNDAAPRASWHANIWQGIFPVQNTAKDGYVLTAPARSFKPNPYGLYDMAGNVWEWTADWYRADAYLGRQGVITTDPRGQQRPLDAMRRKAQRGGSFLCHASYCSRYRPAARQGAAADSGTSHAGVRCAKSWP